MLYHADFHVALASLSQEEFFDPGPGSRSTTNLNLQRIDAQSKSTRDRSSMLRTLMDFYEGADGLADEESEVELMIQLSGMTSRGFLAMDDA